MLVAHCHENWDSQKFGIQIGSRSPKGLKQTFNTKTKQIVNVKLSRWLSYLTEIYLSEPQTSYSLTVSNLVEFCFEQPTADFLRERIQIPESVMNLGVDWELLTVSLTAPLERTTLVFKPQAEFRNTSIRTMYWCVCLEFREFNILIDIDTLLLWIWWACAKHVWTLHRIDHAL